jgi:Nitrous oxidase accessory protein
MKLIVLLLLSCLTSNASNYFIDYATGSDTNSGTSTNAPRKTCRDNLVPGDTVTFKGGVVYWGNITACSGVSYFGTSVWGSGKAILDGSTLITNPWIRCTNAIDCGGSTNWSKIWRNTIPTGISNCLPTMLWNGTNLCQWSQEPDPTDKIFWEVLSEWRPVQPTNISTTWIRDKTYLTQTNGYYNECFTAVWVTGNSTVVCPITNYVQASNTIRFANSTPTYTDRNGYYALINHPQFIDTQGEWAVRTSQNRIYLWPIGNGNPNTNQIAIARRGCAFQGFAHDVKITGFEARGYYQPPNENGYSGQFAAIGNSDWITHNVTVTSNNLYFFKSFNSGPIIDIERGSNAIVSHNSIHDSLISRGMLVNGSRGAQITNNLIYRINGTGIYFNAATNGLLHGNTVKEVIGIHGNGISVYGNSTNVIISANTVSNCTSLLTYEQSANLTFRNNIIDANGKDYRISEWGGTWGPIRWYNNTLANNPNGTIFMFSGTNPSNYVIQNNLISGGGKTNQSYNIYTALAWFQEPIYGWHFGPGESVQDPTNVYTSPFTHNWHLKTGSPASVAGTNLNHLFTTDLNGKPRGDYWDIGAYQDTPATYGLTLRMTWNLPYNWHSNPPIVKTFP